MHKCVQCGKLEQAQFSEPTRSSLIAQKWCFSCHFFECYGVFRKDWPTVVRAKGKMYSIGLEHGFGSLNDSMRGYGGQPWLVHFNDGRLIRTTNLWSNGDIPAHFLERLPDNAELLQVINMPTPDPKVWKTIEQYGVDTTKYPMDYNKVDQMFYASLNSQT